MGKWLTPLPLERGINMMVALPRCLLAFRHTLLDLATTKCATSAGKAITMSSRFILYFFSVPCASARPERCASRHTPIMPAMAVILCCDGAAIAGRWVVDLPQTKYLQKVANFTGLLFGSD